MIRSITQWFFNQCFGSKQSTRYQYVDFSSSLHLIEIENRLFLSASPLELDDSENPDPEPNPLSEDPFELQAQQINQELIELTELLDHETANGSEQNNLAESTPRSIVFVDDRLPDVDILLGQFEFQPDDTLIVMINSQEDGISQISHYLGNSSYQFETVSVFSHGSDNRLQLGSTNLNSSNLDYYKEQISTWQHGTSENADFLIYGCNVASTADGQRFLTDLSRISGADISASTDLTGSQSQGGDWDLEFQIGTIESHIVMNPDAEGSWNHVLVSVDLGASQDTNLYKKNENDNYGASTWVEVDAGGGGLGEGHILMQFDISTIPAGATITGATLKLFSQENQGGIDLNVYRLTESWTEGNQDNAPGRSNWEYRNDTDLWSTEGGTVDSQVYATLSGNNSTGWHHYDITSLVQEWYTGTHDNYGLMLASPSTGGNEVEYHSKEAATNKPILTIDYTVPNQAPTASNNTIAINEDTPRTIALADLGYNDPDTDPLDHITITSLETAGSLQLNGGDVSLNQQITLAQINAGQLVFTPAANANGVGYSQFQFTVNDGTVDSVSSYTIEFDVNAVNDAPTATSVSLNLQEDMSYTIGLSTIGYNDVDGDDLDQIEILTIPGDGSLELNGVPVSNGTHVTKAQLQSSQLVFIPDPNEHDSNYASIDFRAHDGTQYSSVETMFVSVSAVNDLPTAADNTITINEDSPRTLAAADFGYSDIESDPLDHITITSLETAGSLTLDGNDVTLNQQITIAQLNAGQLVFTPANNANGTGYSQFQFTVNDGSGDSVSPNTITFDVTPVNDAPTNSGPLSIPINEGTDTTGGIVVTTLTASDVDTGDTLNFTIVGGADSGQFSIPNSSTGDLHFDAGVLDFELQSSYQVVVRATDSGGSFVDQTVTLSVQNINEAPTVSVGSPNVNLPENTDTSSRVFITNISISDDSIGTNNLLVAGADASFFEIDSGQLFLKAGVSLDYETQSQYQVTIEVDDPGIGAGAEDTANVTVQLSDIDEFDVSPASDSDASADEVNENASVGTTVGIIASATDADGTNNSVTYSLSDDAGGLFAINTSTGEVTVAGSLNYETATSHTIEVTATSSDGSTSVQNFNIAINDVDEFDISPIVDSNSTANSVSETASVGTSVGIIATASDADGSNNTVTYSLIDDEGGRFTINSATGEITVASALNYESATGHGIEVMATSADGSSSTQTYFISVTDEDEFDVSPVVDSDATTNQVDENVAVGTSVGIIASASDADGTNNAVSYSLSDDAGGLFTINSGTGEVTVAGSLDFESATSHNIEVTATSSDGSTSVQSFSIAVNDLDEFDVSPISDTNAAGDAVSELATAGTSVGIVASASDADGTNNTVTYSLSDDAGGLFAINASTGEVTVAAGLDFETATSHNIEVTATSSDGSTSTRTFSIAVTDEDEFDVSPVINIATAHPVLEDSTIGSFSGIYAQATDADGSNNTITYSLTDDAGGLFAINPTSGVVTIASSLDYETATSHTIEVTATSSDGSSSVQTFVVNVADRDEFDISAITDSDAATDSVSESATIGQSVGVTAFATDADGTNNAITYSLNDDAGGRFAINSSTGQVTVASALDYESATSHTIEVLATSADGSSSTQTYLIAVTDEDEFDVSPVINITTAYPVLEDSTIGSFSGIYAQATDADGSNNTITYSLTDDAGGLFAINSTSGVVTIASSLDYETATSHTIEVTATSSDGSSSAQTFIINVADRDEFDISAITDSDAATDSVSESATIGQSVGVTAFASDADGTNNAVTYSLNDNAGGRFAINSSTGQVTVASALDFEAATSHTIEVLATSADGSSSTQTYLIAINDDDEFDVSAVTDSDPASNSVDENASAGASVGIVAFATDLDGTNNSVSYSLTDDSGGRFTIDPNTGEVTVISGLDFESNTSHTIEVTATSSDGSSSSQTFAISINDLDEFDISAITDTNGSANTVSESANVGSIVGITAFASDQDGTNNQVTYSLSNDAGGRFAINSSTGEVTVASTLNYESNTSHTIEVTATSADGSFSSRSFTITVTDEDEFDISAISDSDAVANQVAENAAAGTQVGITAFASDADGTNNAISYSLTDDAGGKFAINSSTGIITVAGALDFEVDAIHTIEVTASSSDGSSVARTFTITVINQNDAPTDIHLSSNQINENSTVGTVVGNLATDDQDPSDIHLYQIISGNDGTFGVDGGGNLIIQQENLNFENQTSYTLGIRSTDSGSISIDRTFVIFVQDVNDRPVGESTIHSLTEDGTMSGSTLTAGTMDEDGDPMMVHLVSGPTNSSSFTLDTDGSFSYSPSPDFNGSDSFTFRLYDGQDYSDTMTVHLNVGAVNDAPVGHGESFTLNQGILFDQSNHSVLQNDMDIDGDPLVAQLVSHPAHGTLAFNTDGTFTYQPDMNYSGDDEFFYVLNDGTVDGNTVRVQLTINAMDFGSADRDSDDELELEIEEDFQNDDLNLESDKLDGDSEDLIAENLSSESRESASDSEIASDGDSKSALTSAGGSKRSPFGFEGIEDRVSAFSDEDAERRAGLHRDALKSARLIGSKLLKSNIDARDIGLEAQEILLQNHAITTWFFDSSKVWKDSTSQPSDDEQEVVMKERLIQGSILTGSLLATTGYFLWALRGGVLMATFMSSLPNWRFIDPLPVIDRFHSDETDLSDEVGIQEMLDGGSQLNTEN